MRIFGEQCSYDVVSKESISKISGPAYTSFDIAKNEATTLSKRDRGTYYIYKLVAIVAPKPTEVVTRILPETPPTKKE